MYKTSINFIQDPPPKKASHFGVIDEGSFFQIPGDTTIFVRTCFAGARALDNANKYTRFDIDTLVIPIKRITITYEV